MTKFVPVLLVVLITLSFFSSGIPNYDKYLHYSFSLSIFSIGNYFFNTKMGFVLAGIAGISKEIYDYFSPTGTADINDLIADFGGISEGHYLSTKYPPMIYLYIRF